MRIPRQQRRQARPARRGAVIIEFSLVFLIFLMLAVATFEFGRAVWTEATVTHAARTAARYAMMHGSKNMASPTTPGQTAQEATEAEIVSVAKAGAVGLKPASISVSVSYSPNNDPGSQVAVSVSYPFKFVAAPLLGVPNGMNIGRTSAMTIVN